MSTPRSDSTIWQKRIDSLLDEKVNGRIPGILTRLPATLDQYDIVKKLIENLALFGKQHFDFFQRGFSSGKFKISDLYPPEHVYSSIVDQIGYDISVFEHIIYQRSCVDETLKKADCLAQDALKPAIAKGWLPQQTVALCYYQKFATIRVIPYLNVALIGIPYSCQNTPRDLLSIPHEVGHYVYWRGMIDNEKIYLHLARVLALIKVPKDVSESQAIPEYILNWTEEVFADIYACHIAGELAARAGQDVMRWSGSAKSMYEDDGEHPPSIFRPSIYHKVLYQPNSENKAVEIEWEKQRELVDQKVRSENAGNDDPNNNDNEKIKIGVPNGRFLSDDKKWEWRSSILAEECGTSSSLPLDGLITEVMALFGNGENSEFPPSPFWSINKQKSLGEFETLYQTSECSSIERERYSPAIPERSTLQETPKLEKAKWIQLWLYDGWTTEGPSGNPRPGSN